MATFASNVNIHNITSSSPIYANYYYEISRSGNNVRSRAWVRLTIGGTQAWFNNRIRGIITIGGTQVLNEVVKGNTSGAISGKTYDSSWSSYKSIAQNSGNVSFVYRVLDDQGSYFDVTKTYSAASPAPTAPSAPGSLSLPNVAPDKTTTGSWGASSGGSNGVTGYEVQYSVNGGSWAGTTTTTSRSRAFDLNSIGVGHGQTFRFRVRSFSTVNGTKYYSGWSTSATITPTFTAPGVPTSLSGIGTIAPDKNSTVSWSQPGSVGSNGIGGYQVELYVGGTLRRTYNLGGGTRSVTLNISDYASHGSSVYYRVRAYTVGKGTNYYSSWAQSGTVTTNFVAPSVPTTLSSIGAVAPDQNRTVTWAQPSSTGSNGISGYEIELYVGGTLRKTYSTNGSTRSVLLEISSYALQGSSVYYRVRARTIGKSVNYWSGWATSTSVTANFVAPGVPTSPKYSYNTEEPIPTSEITCSWVKPTSVGTNDVAGYEVVVYINGQSKGTWTTTTNSVKINLSTLDIQPGDIFSYQVRAYTLGKSVKYYSDYIASNTLIIVADKFIFVSINGQEFIKHKMFFIYEDGSVKEIKKNMLKII